MRKCIAPSPFCECPKCFDAKHGAVAVVSSAIVRHFVASVLKRIYDVRGSIKPPLGGPNAGMLYPVRYHAWKLTNRLYHWSGLPAQWHAWYDAERQRSAQRVSETKS